MGLHRWRFGVGYWWYSSGSINFADGTATVGTKTKNLKTLFENANKTGDFVSGENRFADYTMHTINFYYLERGAGDSNCKLKFNLPTVPKKSVIRIKRSMQM